MDGAPQADAGGDEQTPVATESGTQLDATADATVSAEAGEQGDATSGEAAAPSDAPSQDTYREATAPPVLRVDDARRLRERALDLYRNNSGFLTAEDIRSPKERFELTQRELDRLLRLWRNTLSQWEAVRNVQTAAMDVLLRVLRDAPGGLEYLRKHPA
jgi:DNA-binding transcriptional regulator YiaG